MADTAFVVTGANTGIGRVAALALARRGSLALLAGRSAERTQPVVDEILAAGGRARFVALDLGDLESVREAAKTIASEGATVDLLVNNAGLAGQRGLTKQGFELAFGTNHLGHFLLTKLLLPRLRQASRSRIVNVSSQSHRQPKTLDFASLQRPTASTTGLPEYGVSKLANVLFTKELARGKAGANVKSCALHPGVVASDVWRSVPWPFRSLMKLFMLSNEEGARTTIHCATAETIEDGGYYDKEKLAKASRLARDESLAKELWERSERWVEAYAQPL